MFDILFPLDRGNSSIVRFVIHQHLHSIPLGEPLNQALAIFISPADQIVCDADVQCSTRSAREDIDPELHVAPANYVIKLARESLANLTTSSPGLTRRSSSKKTALTIRGWIAGSSPRASGTVCAYHAAFSVMTAARTILRRCAALVACGPKSNSGCFG